MIIVARDLRACRGVHMEHEYIIKLNELLPKHQNVAGHWRQRTYRNTRRYQLMFNKVLSITYLPSASVSIVLAGFGFSRPPRKSGPIMILLWFFFIPPTKLSTRVLKPQRSFFSCPKPIFPTQIFCCYSLTVQYCTVLCSTVQYCTVKE